MPDKIKKIRGNDPALSKPQKPQKRGDCRVLELASGMWQWKTDGIAVIIYDPAGKRYDKDIGDIFEIPPSTVNAFRCGDREGLSIEPRDIKALCLSG